MRIGHQPGIYSSWPDAQQQVNRFPGAVFRGFSSKSEAEAYLGQVQQDERLGVHSRQLKKQRAPKSASHSMHHTTAMNQQLSTTSVSVVRALIVSRLRKQAHKNA